MAYKRTILEVGSDWHFVKDLNDLTEETLLKSFTKQRKSLVKKLKHLV